MRKSDQRYPEWWRRRAFYKQVTFSTLRGQTIVKKWQKPRGEPSSEAQAKTQTDFLNLVAAQKNCWAVDQVGARMIAEGSQYAWRDVIGRAVVGRLSEFIFADESIKLVPEIQELLDTISNVPGSMFVRSPTEWIGLQLGTDGDVLTWSDAIAGPGWARPPIEWIPLQEGTTTASADGVQLPILIMSDENSIMLVPV